MSAIPIKFLVLAVVIPCALAWFFLNADIPRSPQRVLRCPDGYVMIRPHIYDPKVCVPGTSPYYEVQ